MDTTQEISHFDRTPRPLTVAEKVLLWLAPVAVLGMIAVASGWRGAKGWPAVGTDRHYIKPAIAVTTFQSGSSMNGWQVGDGLADVLTEELVRTDRFQVVERMNLDAVLAELQLQTSQVTRPQGRATVGRLKNVEYLITGKVTDFGEVSSNDFWARMDLLNVFGSRYKALIRITYHVVEVESGQIVMSDTITRSMRADQRSAEVRYKSVNFGGAMFFKTPMGQVTSDATRSAVRRTVDAIAKRPWQPRIAMVQEGQIVINGGADRGVTRGAVYNACEPGAAIVDPHTGDVLGRLPGQTVGQLEVVQVNDRWSLAKPMNKPTDLHVGQHLVTVK